MGTSRKPLNTFGQFLAGMIGCESMQLYRGEYRIRDTINLSRFKLNCLYESQGLTLRLRYRDFPGKMAGEN